MSDVRLHVTQPDDALPWCRFVVTEQARTYADLIPGVFDDARPELLAERAAELAADITAGRTRAVHATTEAGIVGVAAAGPGPAPWEIEAGFVPAPAPQELARLYVHPDHHGTGLADDLVEAVVEPGPIYLWLIDGNARAHRFYRRRGFTSLPEQHRAGHRAGASWGHATMHRMVRSA